MKLFSLLTLSLTFATGARAQVAPLQPLKFDFGAGAAMSGFVGVAPAVQYTAERGYGFEIPAANSGFHSGGPDALRGDGFGLAGQKPVLFSVKLPEGNYRVTVTLGAADANSSTNISAEARRVMRVNLATTAGQWRRETFLVTIKSRALQAGGFLDNKPDDLETDDRLTLSWSGAPHVCALEIERADDALTVYIAGDSTVTNQREEPRYGWGQMLPQFFGPDVAVANHAEGGESLVRFEATRRLEKLLETIKPGDYLFIQFAHNDQKPGENFSDPYTTYQQRLKRYADAARAKGAIPVLVTPPHRATFSADGTLRNSLKDYPDAMRQLAQRENIPLLDLNAQSRALLETLEKTEGQENIKSTLFLVLPLGSFPGQTGPMKDVTHFSPQGALEMARLVAREINAKIPALVPHLTPQARALSAEEVG